MRQKYGPQPITISNPQPNIDLQKDKEDEAESEDFFHGSEGQKRLDRSLTVSTQTEAPLERLCEVLSLHWDGVGVPSV